MLARRAPMPRLLVVVAQALVTLVLLTVVFARGQALVGVLPGPEAIQRLADLLMSGADDVVRYAAPAPATDGIRLMLIGGVLLVGLIVDALAVTFRSAAPAGLPLLALYSVAAGLSEGGAAWLWFLLAVEAAICCFCWPRAGTGSPSGGGSSAARPDPGAVRRPVRRSPPTVRRHRSAPAAASARWRWEFRCSYRRHCPRSTAACWPVRGAGTARAAAPGAPSRR